MSADELRNRIVSSCDTTDEDAASTQPKRSSLQAAGIRLSYLEWGGAGSHCLLLHGITSNARTWWRLAPRLAKSGLQVVALDMPGHGESDNIADHRLEAVAGLVAAAIRTLDLGRVTLVGHSWGGAVALALAASKDAGMVDRIALMDPALTMSSEVGRGQASTFSKGLGAPIAETSSALRAANPDWHEADVHWKAEAMLQCRVGAVTGFFTQSGAWNLTPALAIVSTPLLLLVADPAHTIVDAATRAAAERALAASSGRMVVISGTTHNMYRGAGYDATTSALMRWLAASSPSAS